MSENWYSRSYKSGGFDHQRDAERAPRTRHEYEKYLTDFVRFAGISGRPELLATKSDQRSCAGSWQGPRQDP
jgi:hypothetical protein